MVLLKSKGSQLSQKSIPWPAVDEWPICPDCGFCPATHETFGPYFGDVHPEELTPGERLDEFEVLGADEGNLICPLCSCEFGFSIQEGKTE